MVHMQTATRSDQATAGSGGLRALMRRHPLPAYFVLAYAISWVFGFLEILQAWGYLPSSTGLTALINIPFTFGPAISALILTTVLYGADGRGRLWRRVWQARAGGRWYLFSLLGIPVLITLGMIVQPRVLASFQGLSLIRFLVTYVLNFVLIWFGGGPLGEEIGWRGFALPRLQPRYGSLGGTLILGVLWAFWHLPQFLTPIQGGGAGAGPATSLVNFAVFFVAVMALAVIMTWLFNGTKASLFMAITAHAAINPPEKAIAPLFPAVAFPELALALVIGLGAAALVILVVTRGRLGYQPDQAQPL
jgi:uncharacterized protein